LRSKTTLKEELLLLFFVNLYTLSDFFRTIKFKTLFDRGEELIYINKSINKVLVSFEASLRFNPFSFSL